MRGPRKVRDWWQLDGDVATSKDQAHQDLRSKVQAFNQAADQKHQLQLDAYRAKLKQLNSKHGKNSKQFVASKLYPPAPSKKGFLADVFCFQGPHKSLIRLPRIPSHNGKPMRRDGKLIPPRP